MTAPKRITRLWHLYGREDDDRVCVVSVGPCDWAPHEVPQTEPDPFGGTPLPYLASLSHEPTQADHRRYLEIDEELDHRETRIWND